jgi:hypothetical protein
MVDLLKSLQVNTTSRQQVLYCCSKDRALAASSMLRRLGADGEGQAGYFRNSLTGDDHKLHPYIYKDLQTVDATGGA